MNLVSASTDLESARRATERIARTHYENFTVVSLVLPRRLRQDFYNIYAFCRHADDLADEIESSEESLKRLANLRAGITSLYAPPDACGFAIGRASANAAPDCETASDDERVILQALSETIRKYDIPPDPFLALIDAFEQDRRVGRYETYADVLDYCTRSANPVGHLVLYLCGYRDPERQHLSDFTCTALQLTNFWQDVVPDLETRDRIYIPQEDMRRFGVTEDDLGARRATPQFIELMKFEVDRTEDLFRSGQALIPLIDRRYRTDIALYGRGGRAILERIRDVGYNVLSTRPTLGRWTKLALLARVLLRMP